MMKTTAEILGDTESSHGVLLMHQLEHGSFVMYQNALV